MSCGVGCRCGLDPELLWLWRRPAATAPIRRLAWECPHAIGVALEKAKRRKNKKIGVPVVAQWLTDPTRTHEVSGSISDLAQWVRIRRCRELWCRPVATAPIGPLAWEPPYAMVAAQEKAKR